jgi:hypothetical protein
VKRLVSIIKDKRTQYCIIFWILLLKVIDIIARLLSEVASLPFFAILGFESLSVGPRLVWDGLVIFAVFWLGYRVWNDAFGFG